MPTPPSGLRHQLGELRNLAVCLEALDPRYRPWLTKSGTSQDAWSYRSNPIDRVVATLASDFDQAERLAYDLVRTATWFDPLGDWVNIVRSASPRKWAALRHDALLAMDFRIAAEFLFMLRDDLVDLGHAPAVGLISPYGGGTQHDRLIVPPHVNSREFLRFGVAQGPQLIIVVEGETEYLLIPRVLELLRGTLDDGAVQLVNLKGINGSVETVARAIGVPHLRAHGNDEPFPPPAGEAEPLRPVAFCLVIVDRESKYKTASQREQKRQGMINEIFQSLQASLRTAAMRAQLDHFVRVEAWSARCFEFAHFSDRELAGAVSAIATKAPLKGAALDDAIAKVRTDGGDISMLWKRWIPRPNKLRMAEALWPTLAERIKTDIEGPEVVRVLQAALSKAAEVSRVNVFDIGEASPQDRARRKT